MIWKTSRAESMRTPVTERRISGSRIRQARELKGLTQTELAERIGVTQVAIVKYEKDFAQPSEEKLRGIALQTGFPPSFFRLPPTNGVPLGTHLLFRARAVTAKYEQIRVHRFAETVHEAIDNLAVDVNLIEPNIPRLEVEPATAARLTRSQMGISPDRPVEHLIRSIERAGVRVLALPLESDKVDAFSYWSGGDTERPVIAVISGRPSDRMRWSVAHELGHLVLHRALNVPLKQAEKEANLFAGEFLMPEDAIREEIIPPVTLMDIATLKPRWKVSMQALVRRAYVLEIISERQYNYLFAQISARGWRVKEPANLDIPRERPRLLKRMVEVVFKTPVPYSKVATRLRWTEQFTREILDQHAERNDSLQSSTTAKGRVLRFHQQGEKQRRK